MTDLDFLLNETPPHLHETIKRLPQVPGFPGEFVVPQAWVKLNCPNGFKLPDEALHAAEKFLFG